MDATLYEQEFVEFITSMPSLEALAKYRLTDKAGARLNYLLEANQRGVISPTQQAELDSYLHLEHLMRIVKYRAYEKLAAGTD